MTTECWLGKYDKIRERAEMEPQEREQADKLLKRGFLLLLPGFGKSTANKLLTSMANRYETAHKELESLPELPETRELQKKYEQYFAEARDLFTDCKKLLSNPLSRGHEELKQQIKARKLKLVQTESEAKDLDHKTRAKIKESA